MKRIAIFAFLAVCSTLAAVGQPRLSRDGPLISLYLPHGFPSEKVQVQYFLLGPFGGYGGFVQAEPNRQSIDFIAAVDGKPAGEIKVIAFLPGCEFIALDFALAGTAMWRQLDCRPLNTITLHGQIQPPTFAQGKRAEIEVSYQADWAFKFFGIADGPVPTILLGSVPLSDNGDFTIEVPDFQSQPNLGRAGYAFVLREVKTGNFLAFLLPENASHLFNSLTVSQSYPSVVRFTATPPN